ncbi:MAG TPA: substrate-binding domain-containing protein [Sphingomonas sp.]|uniref:substrate-binding domain-containing protein n=1 Tax=Sphingomonas sp. TaxID=28214 RepID=UPI002C7D3F3F|nr:substrate-binding domain-containing protein [Sphingomonas sp.]HMI21074.1 substrate-binding domain-containing protein [Sphingomonas sp.]
MMTLRVVSLLSLGALAIGTLSSCAKHNKDDVQIVASFHNMAEPFFVAMRRNLEDEARKLHVDATVVDGQSNSAKQTADVAAAMADNVDGIILAPTDVNALTPAVKDVVKADIPIVTVDRRVEGMTPPVPHVGADNIAGGAVMAKWVIDSFPKGARIVLITGQPGSSSAIDRTHGIEQAFAASGPRYRIVTSQTANWQRDQGLTVAQNILTSLGAAKPDVILAEDDDMALGAVEALRAGNVTGVSVLGFNATPDALRAVKAGTMAATVEQSPSRQIRTALDQLVAHIRTKAPMAGASITPVLITRANLSQAERIGEAQ